MAKTVLVQKMNKALRQIQKVREPVKWVLIAYLSFVGITLAIWLIVWLLSALIKVPDLSIGLKFIDQLTNAAFIGFVCFGAGCFLDLNKNGVPDGLECKVDIKKPLDNLLSLRSHPDNE